MPAAEGQYEVVCPHCRKPFQAPLMDGAAARYRGFKCPHCKLFVPFTRSGEEKLAGEAE
jgi:phage FluMu protein Com